MPNSPADTEPPTRQLLALDDPALSEDWMPLFMDDPVLALAVALWVVPAVCPTLAETPALAPHWLDRAWEADWPADRPELQLDPVASVTL